jgi:hypothetical protein
MSGTSHGRQNPANTYERRTAPRSYERDMVRRWHYLLCLPIASLPDIGLADPA